MRFEGKVAFVTGGSRGIGAAVARRFVREGARVVVADIREEGGQALAGELGENALFVPLDVSDPAAWSAAVDRAVAAFGGIDILVNNAGIFFLRPMTDTTPEEFERVFRVNQLGPFLGMNAVVPAMRQRGGGVIVNMASMAGNRGDANTMAYAASKWALRGMTKVAASELGVDGIRVVSVHPGAIDTPMNDEALGKSAIHAAAQMNPLGRVGVADDVAGMVLWLASEEAAYCTGSEYLIDGGATAR